MPINAMQAAQIKAAILANPDLNITPGPNVPDLSQAIANLYNLSVSPDYWVWRTAVTESELVSNLGPDGTSWSWSAYIARNQGERDAWSRIFNGTKTCNPSLANVRAAFSDIFSGSTNSAPAQRTHLSASCRRRASRIEKLFAIGSGTTTTPALLGYEGPISSSDIEYARNLP